MVSVIGGGGFIQMVRVVIYINTNIDFRNLKGYWYSFSQYIFYKPNSTKLNFLVGSIHVLYFILFF